MKDTDLLVIGAIIVGGIIAIKVIPQLIGAAIPIKSVENVTTPICQNELGGYHCYNGKNYTIDLNAPPVTTISDTITIVKDNGNTIPKNSWMVYILEDEVQAGNLGFPDAELDLVPDNRDGTIQFHAAYQKYSVYPFKLTPKVGHKYQRTIIRDINKKTITYILQDLTSVQQERFVFKAPNMTNARISMFSQGIEHWNFVNKSLFPDRFDVVTTPPVLS